MKKNIVLIFCLYVVTSIIFATNAFSDNDSDTRVVVFGDSLSDNGNLEALINLQGRQYPPETFGGRASDGLLGVEVLAQLTGDTLEPSLFILGMNQGNNYAVATARARDAGGLPINLTTQVGAYLQNTNGVSSPNNVYVFMIGSNDLRDAFFSENGERWIINEALDSIEQNLTTLIHSGAKKIMVANIPSLIDLPEIRASIADLPYREKMKQLFKAKRLSYRFNKKLRHILYEARHLHTATKIVAFDFSQWIQTIISNTYALGFTNTREGCLQLDIENLQYSTTACDLDTQIDSYLFFDQIHLSGAGHDYLGRALYAQFPR